MTDLAVHDGPIFAFTMTDLAVHDGPIFAFTMVRNSHNPFAVQPVGHLFRLCAETACVKDDCGHGLARRPSLVTSTEEVSA
jgi:hypothetical protein